MRIAAALASLLTVTLLTPQQASAKVVSYKITDGFTATYQGAPGVGGVLFSGFAGIPYVRGKMVLSSTPDGEGAMRIGDMIQAYATYPGSGSYTYRAKPDCIIGSSILTPVDITNLFFKTSLPHFPTNNITVRFMDWCGGPKTIGPVYIVHIDDSDQIKPFLDLPWDYSGKGLSFSTAATAINSYFDHEYPLLSRLSVLPETVGTEGTIVTYRENLRTDEPYSSHDGYDWGKRAEARSGESVLAAASGAARFVDSCGACGNAIFIDHGNGFQTRYYHLQTEGLFVSTPGIDVHVDKAQTIGRVGFTGNVRPGSEDGAHIHFMVVYDKNADGNFEDNIPDGLVDPFGWQSKDDDPWENYTFNYGGVERIGMKSSYLWTTPLGARHIAIPSNGGSVDVGKNHIIIPSSANNNQEFELKAFLTSISAPTSLVGVLGPGIVISALDILGNAITHFSAALTLTIDFAEIDLSRYDPGTISLYSSQDGQNWVKEEVANIDMQSKTATAQINHLTYFALMAERIDTTAPTTNVSFEGISKPGNIYHSNVSVGLSASDGAGLGVDYIAYNLDDGDWKEYVSPVVVSDEGVHKITYYSVDNDDNIEEKETREFIVLDDTAPPVTSVELGGDIFSGTTYRSDVEITLSASDGAGFGIKSIKYNLDGGGWQNYEEPFIVSELGQHDIQYYAVDIVGNTEETKVINFTIQKNLDEIPPEISVQFDILSRKFIYTALDSSGSAILSQTSLDQHNEELIAIDEANNKLSASIEKNQYKILSFKSNTLAIKSLQYNLQPGISLQSNSLAVLYSFDKQGKLNVLTQTFLSKIYGGVVLSYDFKNNTTGIVESQGGKIINKKINGMRILQLSTNSSRLEYRY
jgi:murein DD-endopeptidase MepM/ murein hydrolase activator NlpD